MEVIARLLLLKNVGKGSLKRRAIRLAKGFTNLSVSGCVSDQAARISARSASAVVVPFRPNCSSSTLEQGRGEEGRAVGPVRISFTPSASRVSRMTMAFARTRRAPGQRQIVDTAPERLGERQGQLDGGVSVVALTHVQQTRNAADPPKSSLLNLYFAATQGEQQAVLRDRLGKLGVVGALGTVTVTAPTRKKWLISPAFTLSITAGAACIRALRAKPMVMKCSSSTCLKPSSACALAMTAEKSSLPDGSRPASRRWSG